MQNNALIKEIFTSIQGEGPYVGYRQLFIRFSKCNLHCSYCDTDFISDLTLYTPVMLAKVINQTNNIHSVSLTGGEPLCECDFLLDCLPLTNKKIYLETNGTLFEKLEKIINYISIISMDIKLESVSYCGDLFDKHSKFIETAVRNKKEIFIKIVFDDKITDDEIQQSVRIAEKYKLLIILQPKMDDNLLNISSETINKIFNKFNDKYDNVRLIPQVHKFINVE